MITIRYLLLLCGSLCLFVTFFAICMNLARKLPKKLFFPKTLWKAWSQAVAKNGGEGWDRLLKAAGHPFHWGQIEWVSLQWLIGFVILVVILIVTLVKREGAFPFFSIILLPTIGYFLPYCFLRWWSNYREEVLSVDIARFINRYVNLLENQVPGYLAMEKAARPTRMLKHYLPTLSEWNKDRLVALETFKNQLGVDDAVILVSNIRTIEQLPSELVGVTMQRLEWTVDNRRMFRHRKKIKSLGIAYSIIVYPTFYIGLIVAMFPWYKLLSEILERYLM